MEIIIFTVFYAMMYTLIIFLGGVFYGLHIHKLEEREKEDEAESEE